MIWQKEIPLEREFKSWITSSDATGVECSEESELWPVKDAVMGSDLGDLFLITLDTPEGTNVVSVDEAVSIVLLGVGGVTIKAWADQHFSCNIHLS